MKIKSSAIIVLSTILFAAISLNAQFVTPLTTVSGQAEVTTVEGIQKETEKLAEHFGHEGADQCGYCNPAMSLTIHALKEEIKDPTDEDIKEYLVGILCRCTGYQAQEIAIRSYLEDDKE